MTSLLKQEKLSAGIIRSQSLVSFIPSIQQTKNQEPDSKMLIIIQSIFSYFISYSVYNISYALSYTLSSLVMCATSNPV